jgi:hypothetical protein
MSANPVGTRAVGQSTPSASASTTSRALASCVSAGVGAAVAETVTYPLCTLKSHAQVGNLRRAWRDAYHAAVLSRLASSASVGSNWWARGAWGGLYRGLRYAVMAQTITAAGKWTSYRWLDARSAELPWRSMPRDVQRVINSTSTGIAVSLVTHLFDFVRVHCQLSNATSSVRAQYRGYSKTLGKTVVGGATYVPIFEHLWRTREWPITAAAFTASLVSATLAYPFDYAKQRHIYLGHVKERIDTALPFWRACWTGGSISLARVVPHFAIMMSITGTLEPIILRHLAS